MSNIQEIFRANLLKEKKKLFEASLGRIMQHVNKAKEEGFAILTSWRQSNDKATNLANFQALQTFVRAKGLGYIQLRGHWQECQDTSVPYNECPPDQLKDSVEPSLMVFKIDLKTADQLGKHFDQDAVVYAGPETNGQVRLQFKNGDTMDLGSFNPMTIGQAFSEYRSKQDPAKQKDGLPRADRHFTFEAFSYPAQTFIEKMAESVIQRNIEALSDGLSTSKIAKL
ncbi:MAG: DUF3293 domain-containing protein [Spirochaetes bacterium]|nr:MAG: DUF3293 domain-containing protein [Spirochaetota bacterium]